MTNKDAIEFLKNMISQEGGRAIGASDFMLELCGYHVTALRMGIKALEQEPKTDKYEYHTDHTDCIWYGNDSGCPVTCSQYRDGWNDAMDYIFKNGNGYQPYRHDG